MVKFSSFELKLYSIIEQNIKKDQILKERYIDKFF